MARSRKRRAEECLYEVEVTDWGIEARFNEHAYLNILDTAPFEEAH